MLLVWGRATHERYRRLGVKQPAVWVGGWLLCALPGMLY